MLVALTEVRDGDVRRERGTSDDMKHINDRKKLIKFCFPFSLLFFISTYMIMRGMRQRGSNDTRTMQYDSPDGDQAGSMEKNASGEADGAQDQSPR